MRPWERTAAAPPPVPLTTATAATTATTTPRRTARRTQVSSVVTPRPGSQVACSMPELGALGRIGQVSWWGMGWAASRVRRPQWATATRARPRAPARASPGRRDGLRDDAEPPGAGDRTFPHLDFVADLAAAHEHPACDDSRVDDRS